MRCNAKIPIKGSKGMAETYCMLEEGHEPPCSISQKKVEKVVKKKPEKEKDSIKRCPHGYASMGTCGTCRGKLR